MDEVVLASRHPLHERLWWLLKYAEGPGFDTVVQTLLAHPGDTPVQVRLDCRDGPQLLALDDYPVHATGSLLGELKGIRAITSTSV